MLILATSLDTYSEGSPRSYSGSYMFQM